MSKNLPVSICARIFGALFMCFPLFGEVETAHSSATDFVRSFYEWYVPLANSDLEGPAFGLALKRKASVFSREIQKALKADVAAKSKVSGEIVGLDFDPFLFSQDPDSRYEIVKGPPNGPNQRFSLFGLSEGKRRTEPSVVAEVGLQSGCWVFVNFHDPSGGDLLSLLKKQSDDLRKLLK